jgi:MFS family permease
MRRRQLCHDEPSDDVGSGTGALILRFGLERIMLTGLVFVAVSAVIGVAGVSVAHFWSALVLLGIGWNFAFVAATTMVTQCHRAEERNKVQASTIS